MSPEDFYYLASNLYKCIDDDISEARYRTIISRAYYAALLTARDKGKIQSKGGDSHKQVIDYWKKRKPVISNRLRDLKADRENADYGVQNNIEKRDAGKALKIAKQILDDL